MAHYFKLATLQATIAHAFDKKDAGLKTAGRGVETAIYLPESNLLRYSF